MADLRHAVEVAANVVIVVLGLVITVVIVHNYSSSGRSRTAALIGKVPVVDGVDWTRSKKTLILAVSERCHWCISSVPFYKRLKQMRRKDVRIVAVMAEPAVTNRDFAADASTFADQVIRMPLIKFGVGSTPTLLLVNSRGLVTDEWVGALDDEAQAKVLDEISGRPSSWGWLGLGTWYRRLNADGNAAR